VSTTIPAPPDPGPGADVRRHLRGTLNDAARYEYTRGVMECVAPERWYRAYRPSVTERAPRATWQRYSLYRIAYSDGCGNRTYFYWAGPCGNLACVRAVVRDAVRAHNANAARPGGLA
jgi:hypothetical protein